MFRVLFALVLGGLVVLLNIHYHGLKNHIVYSQLIPNIIAFIALLVGFYFVGKLKDLSYVYRNINLGFIFIVIAQSILISYFLTNQPLYLLTMSEVFIKLPGLLLILLGFFNWIKVKEKRQKLLKEQEEKWKTIVEGVNDIILIIQDGIIKYVNSKVEDILGYSQKEVIGKEIRKFASEEDINKITEILNRKNRTNTNFIISLESKESEKRLFEVNPSYITFEGKPAVIGIVRDITEKITKERELIKAKKRIEEIKEKLHEAQKLAKVGYWEIKLPEKFIEISEEALKIFCDKSENCVYSLDKFLDIVLPEFRKDLKKKRDMAINELIPYETEYKILVNGKEKIIREKVKISTKKRAYPLILGIVQDITEIHQIYLQVLENEERYRNLFEYSNDAIVISDINGNILEINQKALYKLGYSKFDLKILNLKGIFNYTFKKVYSEWLKRLFLNGHLRFESEVITNDKRTFPAEISASLFEIKNKKYIQLIIRDIADRKLAEKELRMASIVFDNALEGIIITDKNGTILRVNRALLEITGYEKKELIGWEIDEIPIFKVKENNFINIWKRTKEYGRWQGEFISIRKNGEIFPIWLSIIQVVSKNEVSNYIIMISDITRRKHKERKLRNLAYYDNLTKLPNRVYFLSKLKSAIGRSYEEGTKIALFFIDLDGFKNVNDNYGHKAGDKLLQEVAKRLKSSVRKDDFVARLAGDEFVILMEGIENKKTLENISKKIINSIGKPYIIDGSIISIGTSIGISILPDDAQDIETFLKHADFAMYHSKISGKNRFTFYLDILNNSN